MDQLKEDILNCLRTWVVDRTLLIKINDRQKGITGF